MESFAKEKSFQFLQSLQWDSGKPDFVQEMSRQLRMQNQWRLESEMAYLASYNHHCGQRLPKALQSSFSSIVTESCASSLYSVHEAYQVIHSWRPFSTVWSSSSAHSCLQALRRRRRRHRQSKMLLWSFRNDGYSGKEFWFESQNVFELIGSRPRALAAKLTLPQQRQNTPQ